MSYSERLQKAAKSFTGLDANGALREITGLNLDAQGIAYELYGSPVQEALPQLEALLGGGLTGGGLDTTTRTNGVDGYDPNETDEAWWRWAPDSGSAGTPLILAPFTLAAQYTFPDWDSDLHLYASYGFTVIAVDAFAYGNQNSQSLVDSSIAWAGTEFSVDTTRVCLLGDSAGAATALNYMWRDTADNVTAAVLRIPAVAVEALHDRDPTGNGADIESAYLAEYDTLEEGYEAHDPSRHTADVASITDKLRLYYSASDTTIPPSDVEPFVAATGINTTLMPGDHTLANFPTTLASQIVAYFMGKVGLG